MCDAKKNGVALWSTRAVTAHKCSLKRCVAAGRKDLLLCSDLHLGMISRYLFITPPVQGGMWVGGGFLRLPSSWAASCLLPVHRRVSRSDGFIHSVVVCCACLLSPTGHKKKTQPHLSGGCCSQLSCIENQQGFRESQLDG